MIQQNSQKLHQFAGIALVNLATVTWATNVVLGRWLGEKIGPLTLSAARFFVASIFFAALLQRYPPEERRIGQDRWLLIGMALSGVAIFSPTLYFGLRFTTAVNATLITALGPLITGLLAALLIMEPMSRRQIVGALAALGGVIFLVSGGSINFWDVIRANFGDLIVLGAVALWGLYSVLARKVMRHRSALSASAFSSFLGLPLLLLAAAWEVRILPVDVQSELIMAILFIGIASTVIGFLAWNAGVNRLGPSGAMVFYNMLPLYGAFLAHFFLGESLGLPHVLGGSLIIGGGLWAGLGHS